MFCKLQERLEMNRPLHRSVACGARHSCALTTSGRLYTWGCNLHEQCGVSSGSGTTVPLPSLVASLDGLRVTSVAAGLSHTIVCTDAGEHILTSFEPNGSSCSNWLLMHLLRFLISWHAQALSTHGAGTGTANWGMALNTPTAEDPH